MTVVPHLKRFRFVLDTVPRVETEDPLSESLDVGKVKAYLRTFAKERDWEQFHTPKNLVMALAGEAGETDDCVQAAKWYLKAAGQGHRAAQFNLGLMYGQGNGVPRDGERDEGLRARVRALDRNGEGRRGTVFTICLPTVASDHTAAAANDRELRSLSGSETVLLAEDEDGVRASIRAGLLQRPFDVAQRLHGLRVGIAVSDHIPLGVGGRRARHMDVRTHAHRARVADHRLPWRAARNVLPRLHAERDCSTRAARRGKSRPPFPPLSTGSPRMSQAGRAATVARRRGRRYSPVARVR